MRTRSYHSEPFRGRRGRFQPQTDRSRAGQGFAYNPGNAQSFVLRHDPTGTESAPAPHRCCDTASRRSFGGHRGNVIQFGLFATAPDDIPHDVFRDAFAPTRTTLITFNATYLSTVLGEILSSLAASSQRSGAACGTSPDKRAYRTC